MEPSDIDVQIRRSANRWRRDRFLTLALAFEGGLAFVAMAFGYWTNIHPLEHFSFEVISALKGVALTIPLFGLFLLFFLYPFGPLRQIRKALLETLGSELAICRWWELIGLAVVTGFSEEALFRGLFQEWIGMWWSSLIFGLLHWVTPLYALLAGGIGLLLGWSVKYWTGNLITPIVVHILYDYLAFLVVARAARNEPTNALPSDE